MPRSALIALAAVSALAAPVQGQDQGHERVSIDVYAIPSQPIVAAVAKASDALSAQGMTTFYAKGQAVHVTLYLTQYPEAAVPDLLAAVSDAAKGCKAFPLAVDGVQRTASDWLFLQVERSPALQRLADRMTLAAEPLRARGIAAPAWMAHYPAKLPAFERYGSPNVFMQFDPHLTLLANETNPNLGAWVAAMEAHRPHALGAVEGVGVGLVDAQGQLVTTLAEYRCAQ